MVQRRDVVSGHEIKVTGVATCIVLAAMTEFAVVPEIPANAAMTHQARRFLNW